MLAGRAQKLKVLCEAGFRFQRNRTEKRFAERQFCGHAAKGPYVHGLVELVVAQEQVWGAVLTRTKINAGCGRRAQQINVGPLLMGWPVRIP